MAPSPTRAAAAFVFLAVLLHGCGDDEASERSDPVAVSKAFVHAVADGDPAACGYLSAAGVDQFETSGPACADAIGEEDTGSAYFNTSRPQSLVAELDAGKFYEKGDRAYFAFCTPNETRVHLNLVESDSGWQVDGVGWGGVVTKEFADGRSKPHPCSIGRPG